MYNLQQNREEIAVVAGALENIDVARIRGGQVRKVLTDAVHPKWLKDESPIRYYDVGLLILKEVSAVVYCLHLEQF